MHRNARRVIALALLPLITAACDDFLDVNQDPNNAVRARVDLTLPSVIGIFGHSVLNGSLAFWGVEWMQQFSFNGNNRAYSNLHRYEVTTIDANGPWQTTFASVMKEANNIVKETDGNDNLAAYNGVAKFLLNWSFSIATDSWGPVPFEQALNPAIRDPAYDEQKVVYAGLQKGIDDAIVAMGKASNSLGTTDLLYRGDIAKWMKLAYTVQGQLHMRLSSAPGENKTDRAQKALDALSKGMSSNADDADFAYPGGNGRRPPWYALDRGFNDEPFAISEFLIEMMKQRNDPRVPVFARPAAADTPNAIVYRGHKPGSGDQDEDLFSKIGNYFVGDSTHANWVSYSQAKFLEAEARLYLSGAAAADAPYRAAIRANMEKLSVAPAAIEAYLAARPALASVANPLEEIMREKYVANFLKLEVWSDWRRTGFPVVTSITSEYLNAIPQRIRSPDSEVTNNADKLAATGIPTTLQGMLVKVWWASGTQ